MNNRNSRNAPSKRSNNNTKGNRRLHFNTRNLIKGGLSVIVILYCCLTTYLLFIKPNGSIGPPSAAIEHGAVVKGDAHGAIRKRQFMGKENLTAKQEKVAIQQEEKGSVSREINMSPKSNLNQKIASQNGRQQKEGKSGKVGNKDIHDNVGDKKEDGKNAPDEFEVKSQLSKNLNEQTGRVTMDDDRQNEKGSSKDDENEGSMRTNENVLTAYIEEIQQEDWEIQPLPIRKKAKASFLTKKTYPNLSSCTKLPQQWPIDEDVAPTNQDPFLPWIHDVFPSADGKFIQFIAQNKRRCQSGKKMTEIKKFMQPNVALFQHVPVKRINDEANMTTLSGSEQRYRLASHEDADEDGMETRFICRFKPSMEETLSVHDFNYDFHTWRKAYASTFTYEGFDNHMIWTSQLLFRCPVPESLQQLIMNGKSVEHDYATHFVDLIPIRTPPRYGPPMEFLPPKYEKANIFNATEEWGHSHILPSIEDSGRWENIPICKPSLMTYPDDAELSVQELEENDKNAVELVTNGKKKHKLIACTWTSAGFYTRGERTFVDDGRQRLLQWLEYNKLVGVDHVYIFDNSGAVAGGNTLKPVTDLFQGFATRIDWPAKVCNNRPGNNDNKGERSSQYAAESSCRLRFGAHAEWLAAHDTDEYLVPLGSNNNLKDVLNKVEEEDIRILNFYSKRSKLQVKYYNTTGAETNSLKAGKFDPALPPSKSFLQVYNCNNERPPRKKLMPAEKAIYRPDYVHMHFVHYSTVTGDNMMSEQQAKDINHNWRRVYKEEHIRYVDEETEATMLHTKAIVERETLRWDKERDTNVGIAYPPGTSDLTGTVTVEQNELNLTANCYPVEKIDQHWAPRLESAMKERIETQVNN